MKNKKSVIDLYQNITRTYLAEQKRFFTKHPDAARIFLYAAVPTPHHFGQRLLDIGCGNGQDVEYFTALGYQAWGIDISPKMIEVAKEKVAQPERILQGNFLTTRSLPFDTFDAVFTRFVLHYQTDIDAAYRQIAKFLKPNGLFAAVVSHPLADAKYAKPAHRGQPRMVHFQLYAGKVTVIYPAHTLAEYLSPTFFKLFQVEQVGLEPVAAREDKKIPGYLGIVARKK